MKAFNYNVEILCVTCCVWEVLMCVFLLFKLVCTATLVEVNRWYRHWVVQRSKRKYVWYGYWGFPALKQMDCTCLGTMCMEIFSPMQGCSSFRNKWNFSVIFWLWKGTMSYPSVVFVIRMLNLDLFSKTISSWNRMLEVQIFFGSALLVWEDIQKCTSIN